jgi:hypothetical protein
LCFSLVRRDLGVNPVNLRYAIRVFMCSCGKVGVLWPDLAVACPSCGGTDLDYRLIWREQVEVDLRLVLETLESMDEEVN